MWHLLLCNLKGRRAYDWIVIAAVCMGTFVVLLGAIMSQKFNDELEGKQLLLGPELAIVPTGTKETGHIYLTKGPPPQGSVSADALVLARNFEEVVNVSPQKTLGSVKTANGDTPVIAFDPASDILVQPWLLPRQKRTLGALTAIAGNDVQEQGEISIAGKTWMLDGKLRHTGSFMDRAIFVPMAEADMGGAPTWILIGLKPGLSLDIMTNKLATNIDNVEIIARPEILKTINEQLHGVTSGGGLSLTAILIGLAAFGIIAALFILLINDRERELGLFKAMGANNGFVFRLILLEAGALGIAGIFVGAVLACIWICAGAFFQIGGFVAIKGATLARMALILLAMFVVCILAALFPAWRAARKEPYAAIRGK